MTSERRRVVLVPIKSFATGKSRLRSQFTSREVEILMRRLAAQVISASAPTECIVVCDDLGVAEFARENAASVLLTPPGDLNVAVSHAYRNLDARIDTVIVAHGDLSRPDGLGVFDPLPGLTIITDRHGTGTNVMALPSKLDFSFSYGDGSAQRHRDVAKSLGLHVEVITNSPWGLDVDGPDDVALARDAIRGGP